MIALLAGSALAASPLPEDVPAGYRQHAASTTRQLSGRLVLAPGEVTVFQQVPRVRFGTDRISGDFSIPLVQAVGPDDWGEAGIGRIRGEGRLHVGLDRRVALGLSAGGLLAPKALWVTTWGSQSRETQPGWDVTGFAEIDMKTTIPWTIAVGAGLGTERYVSAIVPFLIDVRSFQTIPLAGRLSLVVEEELVLIDHTVFSGRGLLSWAADGITADLGVQVPLVSLTTGRPLPQVVAQVRTAL
ncbi:MAG: hypothetical protein ACI8RZ_006528 [Myxococcota bacterium]|jgi:hypothetical protein